MESLILPNSLNKIIFYHLLFGWLLREKVCWLHLNIKGSFDTEA